MMQSPGFKVFVASALGAFIGSLVGLQLMPMFWWVGMLAGGLVGYVAFDAKAVMRSVAVAYRQTRYVLAQLRAEVVSGGRQLARAMLSTGRLVSGMIVLGLSWTAPYVIITYIVKTHGISPNSFATWFMDGANPWSVLLVAASLNIGIGVIVLFGGVFLADELYGPHVTDENVLRTLRLYSNPTAVLCYWLPRGVILSLTFLSVFFWKLFRLVHSDRRLLCGLDAATGAAAGTYFHNPLVGALVGGLFGLLNYELVSKRWLKLVSA